MSTIEELCQEVQKVQSKLSTLMVELDKKVCRNELHGKIDTAKGDLNGNICTAKNELHGVITTARGDLNDKISTITVDLNEKIINSKGDLGNKISDIQNDLDDKINTTKRDLDSQINTLSAETRKLQNELVNTVYNISTELTNFQKDMDRNNKELTAKEKRFEIFRTFANHEDHLVNHRVSWLMVGESFLIGAFVASAGIDPKISNIGPEIRRIVLYTGLATTASIGVSIFAAKWSIAVMREAYHNTEVDRPDDIELKLPFRFPFAVLVKWLVGFLKWVLRLLTFNGCLCFRSGFCTDSRLTCKCCKYFRRSKRTDIVGSESTFHCGNMGALSLPVIFVVIWLRLLFAEDE